VLSAHRGRLLVVIAILAAIACYVVGLNIAYLDLAAARLAVQQMRAENQKLKTQLTDQSATQVALQAKLTTTEAALEAITPAKNTYNIKPNQSMIVAGGRLTIGLIGAPTNESVNININGKKQSAATGDVINIALEPPTTCQVRVQSFDMFKVVLTASCGQVQ
jgi:type II secretory pathway pseudopilin PulG